MYLTHGNASCAPTLLRNERDHVFRVLSEYANITVSKLRQNKNV